MNQQNRIDKERARAYSRRLTPALAVFVLTVIVVHVLVDIERVGGWKFVLAVLPVIPAVWSGRAVVLNLRQIDEMQRSILVGGMAAGFGATLVAALTIGFLDLAGLDGGAWGPWVIVATGVTTWLVQSMRAAGAAHG